MYPRDVLQPSGGLRRTTSTQHVGLTSNARCRYFPRSPAPLGTAYPRSSASPACHSPPSRLRFNKEASVNREIELHDSVIEDVVREGDDFVVRFSHVVVHETLGTPGVDAGVCLSQEATLRISNGRSSPETLQWPVRITDGELRLGDQLLDNMLPTSINHQGPTLLSLLVYDDDSVFTQLSISGTGLCVVTHGLAEYLDDFPGIEKFGPFQ